MIYHEPSFGTQLPPHVMSQEDFEAIASQRVNNHKPLLRKGGTGKVLWLLGSGDNTKRKSYILKQAYKFDEKFAKSIKFVEMNSSTYPIWVKKPKTKNTKMVKENYRDTIINKLGATLASTSIIIINDMSVLACVLASTTGHGTKNTTAAFRGSLYHNDLFSGLPALVLDDASKCYIPPFKSVTGKYENTKAQSVQYFDYDLNKAIDIFYKPELALNQFDDNFEIINGSFTSDSPDRQGLRSHRISQPDCPEPHWDNAHRYMEWLNKQEMLALDYETSLGFITCLAITGLEYTPEGKIKLKTWVLPHINPQRSDNQHMNLTSFIGLMAATLQCPAPKIWQNGNYDLHYALKYNLPPCGQQHDTMLLWHSMNPKMPQSLASIASIFNYDYYYWKDEIKGGSDEKKANNTAYAVPTSRNGMLTYWRYAGLDTYHTMKAWLALMARAVKEPNALYNYAKEYALMRGPLLETNYKGVNADRPKLNKLVMEAKEKELKALHDLQLASYGVIQNGTDEEVRRWLYDILAAVPPKTAPNKKVSVDQRQLILVAEQHPIYERAIELIRAHREPKKIAEMYSPPSATKKSGLKLRNFLLDNKQTYRFNQSYSTRPYTGRLASQGSCFWDGTNSQNIPASMRSFITADKGKVLIDIDYSSADLYHFAVACGDENMMRNTFADKDTHALHVETILGVPYDEVVAGKKAGDPKVVHPIKGTRQIIKKLSHGGNYGMMPATAYLNAGRESLIAAASYLDINTNGWGRPEFYSFCDRIMIPYFEDYPRQKIWRRELVKECVDNKGYMTCFGGLTVYFDEWKRPKEHDALMRALLAFYGQGGTSGMINEAMLRMYYGPSDGDTVTKNRVSFLKDNDIELLLQTHDSITYQVPVEVLLKNNIINKLLTTMELTCNFNGIDYVVPCEVNIGHSWSKSMPEIKPNATDASVVYDLLDNYKSEGLI